MEPKIFFGVILAFVLAYLYFEGKEKRTYVWIERCQYIKIEEGVGEYKTVNYIPTNKCN